MIVGTEEETFVLHKGLLCFYSDFFRAAFNGPFQEATEGKINLSDIDIETFEDFQVWLYSRILRNPEGPANKYGHAPWRTYAALARLWIFGDKYLIPLLQNDVIDAMHDKMSVENISPLFIVKTAYDETLPGSCLRRAVVDMLVHRTKLNGQPESSIESSNLKHWTTEALADAMVVMASSWESGLPYKSMLKKDRCHYHVHAKGEHC